MNYAKAAVAAALAGLASAKGALPDGVTVGEAIEIASVTLGTFGLVWAVPNRQTND